MVVVYVFRSTRDPGETKQTGNESLEANRQQPKAGATPFTFSPFWYLCDDQVSPLSSAFVSLFVSSRDGHTNTGGILVRAKTTARSGFAASCVRLRPKRGRGRHQTTQDERENLGLGCDDSLDFLIWCPSDLGKIQSTFNAGFVILPS